MSVRQAVSAALGLLNRRDRKLLSVSVAIQMATSLLDLVGVLLLGLVGALAVTVVQSQPPPASVSSFADLVGLGDLSGQQLIVVLAATAAVVLLTKSVVSSYLTRRVLVFLANRQALVSARLTRALLDQPLTFIQQRPSQETAFALMQGAGAATIQMLGSASIALTESALLAVLTVALLLLDPLVTIAAVSFFGLVAFGLQKAMGARAGVLGQQGALAEMASLDAIQEALGAYREVTVTNRRSLYVDRIQALRWRAAKYVAETTFIGLVPKYVFEVALVVGGFALAGILFATQQAVSAVGTLALFLVAGSRVTPSLLRLQGATLTMRVAAGNATVTFQLARELGNPLESEVNVGGTVAEFQGLLRESYSDFVPGLVLREVSYAYPGVEGSAVAEVSLSLGPGQSLAIIGASGAGKSTLADLILGVLEPQTGSVSIGGVVPAEAIHRWPGAITYVPQQVALANGTVRQNVALGLPLDAVDDDRVWEALGRGHLETYFRARPGGLDTQIGEGGVKLSGGQRQRLGIARALYTRPKLLVLDEATSALDAETEAAVTQTISNLEGDVTTVVVAHRLSTVRDADLVAYLHDGHVRGLGSFDELRSSVPSLAKVAGLLGM